MKKAKLLKKYRRLQRENRRLQKALDRKLWGPDFTAPFRVGDIIKVRLPQRFTAEPTEKQSPPVNG